MMNDNDDDDHDELWMVCRINVHFIFASLDLKGRRLLSIKCLIGHCSVKYPTIIRTWLDQPTAVFGECDNWGSSQSRCLCCAVEAVYAVGQEFSLCQIFLRISTFSSQYPILAPMLPIPMMEAWLHLSIEDHPGQRWWKFKIEIGRTISWSLGIWRAQKN